MIETWFLIRNNRDHKAVGWHGQRAERGKKGGVGGDQKFYIQQTTSQQWKQNESIHRWKLKDFIAIISAL